jgi:uncharacterized membrane protein
MSVRYLLSEKPASRIGFNLQKSEKMNAKKLKKLKKAQKKRTTLQALGLGAIAGMRAIAAPALLSHYLAKDPAGSLYNTRLRYLQRPFVATGLKFLAGAEMIGDKLPAIPDRITPPPLAARVLSGAVVGATVAGANERPKITGALLGMAGALVASFGFFYLRKKLGQESGLPNVALGLMEDAVMASGGIALMQATTD